LKLINNINYLKISLFLYPALMFMPFAYSNIVLGSIFISFLWILITKKVDLSNFKKHYKWYLIIIIPWVLTLISTIHSNNMSRGFDFVIQRHPILIYPILYFTINPDQKSKQLGFKTIIFFTLYGIIHSWVNFIYSYPNTFYHFNHNEVQQSTIIQHPYLGMMSLVSLVLLFYLENLKNISKLLLVCIAFLLISGIVLSTSRLAILLLGLIGVYFIFQKLKSKYRWILGGTFVLGILFFVMQTSLLQKFSNELTFEKSPRLLLWNNALQLTKNNESIVGIGIGDYYTKKIDPFWFLGEYQKYKYNFRGLYGYECHNLYVENILLTGILGLFFIAGIGIIFIYLLKQKNELNLILFLLLASFMFTETLLLRQWGIIFYVFVMSLILHSNKPKTQSL
jgi:O-antigen ligase